MGTGASAKEAPPLEETEEQVSPPDGSDEPPVPFTVDMHAESGRRERGRGGEGDLLNRRETPRPPDQLGVFSSRDVKPKRYSEPDEVAERLPSDLLNEALPDLVAALTAKFAEQDRKLRALYTWLVLQPLSERPASPEIMEEETASTWLLALSSRQRRYSSFFRRLCSLAGLESVEVAGYVKGGGYKAGDRPSNQHSAVWNAVKVKDSYGLIDTYLGSRYVAQSRASLGSWEGVSDFAPLHNFFFLSEPTQFAFTHFPFEPRWQLLSPALEIEDFVAKPIPRMLYFQHDVDIRVENRHLDSFISIAMEQKKKKTLWIVPTIGKGTSLSDPGSSSPQVRLMIQDVSSNHVTCRAYFDRPGKTVVDFYGRSINEASSERLELLCSLPVACSADNCADTFQQIPPHPTDIWGTHNETEKLGLVLESHKNAMATAENRQLQVNLKLRSKTELSVRLMNQQGEAMPQHFAVFPNGKSVTVQCFLPNDGLYGLYLFTRTVFADQTTSEKTWRLACSYLVSSTTSDENADDIANSVPLFPKVKKQVFGVNENAAECSLKPVKRYPPISVAPKSGQLVFGFRVTEKGCEPRVFAKWYLLGRKGQPQEMEAGVFVNHKKDTGFVIVSCSKPGMYHLAVYSCAENNSVLCDVANYLVRAADGETFAEPLRFPRFFPAWSLGCYLASPRARELAKGPDSKVSFQLTVPGANRVRVQRQDETADYLESTSSDTWKGDVATGTGSSLKVSAEFEDQADSWKPLLQYTLADGEEVASELTSEVLERAELQMVAAARDEHVTQQADPDTPRRRKKKKRMSSAREDESPRYSDLVAAEMSLTEQLAPLIAASVPSL